MRKLGIVILSTVILVLGTVPEASTEDISQDFRGGKLTKQLFKRAGPNPHLYMRGEPRGLRITLPSEKPPKWPVGIASKLATHGDFEITASYRLLKVDRPKSGFGAGVGLWINMASSQKAKATLARFRRPQQDNVYSTDHFITTEEGKPRHKEEYFPTDSESGRLRFVRTGKTLIYLVAEGNSQQFQELRRDEDFGDDPLIAAYNGGGKANVDIMLYDFRIRAGELSATPAVPNESGRWVWLMWGVGITVVVLVGGLFYWRHRLQTVDEVEYEDED